MTEFRGEGEIKREARTERNRGAFEKKKKKQKVKQRKT